MTKRLKVLTRSQALETRERTSENRRMAALPGSGVRTDQVLATAQAFDKLIVETDGRGASSGK